ncbi:MAG TPA: DUF6286 domain-containing protein [Pseudonocardia sp.]|nr:DUF6286 domain-containing protein [Pseudonocardia sp.]
MIRRHRRVLPASLVALAGLAIAGLTATSCVQLLLHRPPVLPFAAVARLGASLTWAHPLVMAAGAVLAGLGVVLLAAAALPGSPTVLPLQPGRDIDTGATRASLVHTLCGTAADVDGVDRARLRIGRKIRATVRTPLRDAADLAGQVEAALDRRLDDIALAHRPPVRVRVHTTKD